MRRFTSVLVLGLLLLTFLVRVYNFSNIQFDSDFGRDSLFAYRILHEKPTLLGAQASVGGFYLGPLYFYAIAMLFAVFGPVPEIVMLFFAVLNVLVAWIGWKLLHSHVGTISGIIFLMLFAISPMLIAASRGATHMPMMPFITVLVVALLTRALEKNRWIDHLLSGLALGLFLHVHFSALLLFPGYFVAVSVLGQGTLRKRVTNMAVHLLALTVMALPLIVFDLRHGLITSTAFLGYILASATGGNIRETLPHWSLEQKLTALAAYIGSTIFIQAASMIGLGLGLIVSLKRKRITPIFMVLVFLFLSVILLLLLYRGYLFTYYLIVPGTLLLLVAATLLSRLKLAIGLAIALLVVFVGSQGLRGIYVPQFRTISNLTRITAVIEQEQQRRGKPNFEIFKDSSDGLTGLAYEYRFLLTRDGFVPISEYTYGNAEVLYIIREEGNADPLKLGNFEISEFAPTQAQLVGLISIGGKKVEIFALTREL